MPFKVFDRKGNSYPICFQGSLLDCNAFRRVKSHEPHMSSKVMQQLHPVQYFQKSSILNKAGRQPVCSRCRQNSQVDLNSGGFQLQAKS